MANIMQCKRHSHACSRCQSVPDSKTLQNGLCYRGRWWVSKKKKENCKTYQCVGLFRLHLNRYEFIWPGQPSPDHCTSTPNRYKEHFPEIYHPFPHAFAYVSMSRRTMGSDYLPLLTPRTEIRDRERRRECVHSPNLDTY